MAKGIHVGVNGARKVKKIHVGVGGVARKVKKAFVGISGLPYCVYSSEPSKVASVPALSEIKATTSGGNVGNYAVFAAGRTGSSTMSSLIEAYTKDLIHTTPGNLLHSAYAVGNARAGEHLIFSSFYNGTSLKAYADALDSNLVVSALPNMRETKNAGTASVGDYAFFVGGETSSASAYDSALTVHTLASVISRTNMVGTSVGNYALFHGSVSYSTVEVFDNNLVKGTSIALSDTRRYTCASKVGNYAVFAGGYSSGYSDVVDAFDTSLVRTTPTALSVARQYATPAETAEYAMFAGGQADTILGVVDYYDDQLVRYTAPDLSVPRYNPYNKGGASIGDILLFAGGYTSASTYTDSVEAYS